jgi:hypothetical protein
VGGRAADVQERIDQREEKGDASLHVPLLRDAEQVNSSSSLKG